MATTPVWELALTFTLCCHLAGLVESALPCDGIPAGQTGGPSLPQFPLQYSLHVEANIIQSRRTVDVHEFYDYNRSMASISFTSGGQTWSYVLNFQTQERYDIANDTCQAQALSDVKNSVFGFMALDDTGHVRLASVSDVMKFGSKYNESYLGTTEVRGIPVHHWAACVTMNSPNATMRLDYYFAQEVRHWPAGSFYTPVRATVQGTAANVDGQGRTVQGTHAFNHSYEFTDFKPGPAPDLSVFETPRGIVCKNRKATARLPPLPDQMTLDLEIHYGPGTRPTGEKVYLDLAGKVVRQDIRKEGLHEPTSTTIQDFSAGVEYSMDFDEGNCTIRRLQKSIFGHVEQGHLTMSHVAEVIQVVNRSFVYQGERRWRGLLVDAWGNETSDVAHEIYFLKDYPPSDGSRPPIPGLSEDLTSGVWRMAPNVGTGDAILVGLYTLDRSGNMPGMPNTGEMYVNVLNFDSSHPDWDVFDIGLCYDLDGSKISYRMHVEGEYEDLVEGSLAQFYTAVRAAISKAARVSPLRVSQLLVTQSADAPGEIIVFFSILDNPPLPENTAGVSRGPTLVQARASLLAAVNTGLTFALHMTSRSVILGVKLDSLAETTHPEDRPLESSLSYSPGAMAGLGLGMGVVGLLLGLLFAFLVYRRVQPDLSIPYQRDHH